MRGEELCIYRFHRLSRHYNICIGKYGLLSKETERFLSFFFDQHSDVHFIYVYPQFSIAAYRLR